MLWILQSRQQHTHVRKIKFARGVRSEFVAQGIHAGNGALVGHDVGFQLSALSSYFLTFSFQATSLDYQFQLTFQRLDMS